MGQWFDLYSQVTAAKAFVEMARHEPNEHTEQERRHYLLMAYMHAHAASVLSGSLYWFTYGGALHEALEALLDGKSLTDAIRLFDDRMANDPLAKLLPPPDVPMNGSLDNSEILAKARAQGI